MNDEDKIKAKILSRNTGFPYWICVDLVKNYLPKWGSMYFRYINGNYPRVDKNTLTGRYMFNPNISFAPRYLDTKEPTKHCMLSYAIVKKDMKLLKHIAEFGSPLDELSIKFLIKFSNKKMFKVFYSNLQSDDHRILECILTTHQYRLLKVACPIEKWDDPKVIKAIIFVYNNKELFFGHNHNREICEWLSIALKNCFTKKALLFYYNNDEYIFTKMVPHFNEAEIKKLNFTALITQMYEKQSIKSLRVFMDCWGRIIKKDAKWNAMIKHFKSYDNRILVDKPLHKVNMTIIRALLNGNTKQYNYYVNLKKRIPKDVQASKRREMLRILNCQYY